MSKLDSLTLDGLSHFIVLGKRSGFRRVPQHLLITDRYELANALRPFTDVRASDLPRLRLLYRRISQSQKLPETGEFAGHLASALLAAGYCAAKVQKDVGGALPIVAVRDIKPLEAAGVLTASPEDKYARVLEMVPQYLPGEMKGAFANLVTPEAIGTTVAILVLWAGSHALGVGFAIDVLLLAIGFAMAGWSIFAAVGDVIEFFEIMNTARSDADLNRAAKKLAGAIAALGVGTFIALLTRGAGRIAAAKKASVARKSKGGGGASDSRQVPQSALPKTEATQRQKKRTKKRDEPEVGDALTSLPGADAAVIDPRKLTEYALNPDHPVGGNKARVFDSVLGFNRSNADDLLKQIQSGVKDNSPIAGKVDQYGSRFTVDIPVIGPKGSGTVRTGWIYKPGSDIPEMTTLFVK